MASRTSRVVLWLFVLNLGIVFGAGIYEHRIVVSRWMGLALESGVHWNAEAARADDTGLRFWVLVSTISLTLLTLANLFAAWRSSGALRRWWLAAGFMALADRLFTFAYFIPAMVWLMAAPESPESIAAATRWWTLNYLRHAIVLAAWLASLKAFALFHQQLPIAVRNDSGPYAQVPTAR
ncbi:MAG: DUF1772 domain-containing protein [Vicinamibacterales bacterium]